MTPERVSIEARIVAKRMVEQASPAQLRRLLDDIRQPASQEGAAHGA